MDADEVYKARAEYTSMVNIHGRDSQKARLAFDELQEKLEIRDAERTPSQKATEKRRLLKNLRDRLARNAAALDQAEEALKKAQDLYDEAERRLETTAVQVDKCEEELQYLEEEFLRPATTTGPQRNLEHERAHEAIDKAVLQGGSGENTSQIQQLTNQLLELLDQDSGTKEGQPSKKKSKLDGTGDDANMDLPPVPEGPAEPDEIMEHDSDLDSDGPNTKASVKILRQYSSKATRVHIQRKRNPAQTAGKGTGKGGTKGSAPTGGTDPTPGEAHGGKRPGLQPTKGGEAGTGTATPPQATPSTPADGDNARNRWGDGPP